MDLLDLLVISLRTLGKNKLRSGLTVLGVVIGIASVTTMVSLGGECQPTHSGSISKSRLQRDHRVALCQPVGWRTFWYGNDTD